MLNAQSNKFFDIVVKRSGMGMFLNKLIRFFKKLIVDNTVQERTEIILSIFDCRGDDSDPEIENFI